MERFNRVIHNSLYQECMKKNEAAEVGRDFCCHNIQHFFDVARIAMLLNLQENLQIEQEVVYIVAFLHDIGRFEQYRCGTPHEFASAVLAEKILKEENFSPEEIEKITLAIKTHRDETVAFKGDLCDIIYRADKMSRPCYFCKAKKKCHKKDEKKNRQVIW